MVQIGPLLFGWYSWDTDRIGYAMDHYKKPGIRLLKLPENIKTGVQIFNNVQRDHLYLDFSSEQIHFPMQFISSKICL